MDSSFFPIPLHVHIILALLAVLVFGMQFIRYHKICYLVLGIALPCTLLPYLTDSQTFFYGIGVFELAALLLAFILSKTVDRQKVSPVTGKLPEQAEEAPVGEEAPAEEETPVEPPAEDEEA